MIKSETLSHIFKPRTSFNFSNRLMWYPGHQSKALRQLEKGIGHIDLIIEVRDARIPFTSTNPQFELSFARRKRLIVFNKYDLANQNSKQALVGGFKERGQDVVFCSVNSDKSVQSIIQYAIQMSKDNPQSYPTISLVLAGLPNVGKSSLLNRLRHIGLKKGKVAIVGPNAGVTRVIQTRVKIWDTPAIYLVDTPGIFCPSHVNPIEGLKIALTGGTKDRLTDDHHVADYLLFRLNNHKINIKAYTLLYNLEEPTNSIEEILEAVAKKYNLTLFDGKKMRINKGEAARKFVVDFRNGNLGPLTLDYCGVDAMNGWFDKVPLESTGSEFGADFITHVQTPIKKEEKSEIIR